MNKEEQQRIIEELISENGLAPEHEEGEMDTDVIFTDPKRLDPIKDHIQVRK